MVDRQGKSSKVVLRQTFCPEVRMPINETYRTWIQRICELRPKQRITQVQNFVWLLVGIYHSHSVHLSKIAGNVISNAKNESTVRRLSRFWRTLRSMCIVGINRLPRAGCNRSLNGSAKSVSWSMAPKLVLATSCSWSL